MTHPQIALCLALFIGAILRFYGLDWGVDRQTGEFHHFHTDESTIVENAQWIGKDLSQIRASYGKAPMYILWAATHTLCVLSGNTPFDLDNHKSAKFTYITGRGISALMGVLLIYFVYCLGTALHNSWTGALSAALMAVCPGHIQQSHYYTVDPALTFWVGLALLITLRLPNKDWRIYVAFGLVSGLSAGTRLVGIMLSLPFLLVHILPFVTSTTVSQKNLTEFFRQLPWKNIGLATLTGFIVLLICEPFVLLNPQHYFDTSDIRQFAPSMLVAKGELVRVWTLYDFQTTPYLYYLTHLWYYALTVPLEIAGIAGILLAFWKRPRTALILLAWLLPYFLLVAGLHTKPIRYAIPMLPVLIILGAWACVLLGQWLQQQWSLAFANAIPALIVLFVVATHGLAVARLFGHEDSRIVTARWVQKNIPKGSGVMVENGGFPTAWMVPKQSYYREFTDSSYFIVSQNWVPYSSQIDFLSNRISAVDWIVLIEENHLRPFISVPKQYPIGSEIYLRLNDEELGFKRIAQFKNHPALGPWTRNESDAEPSVTAFDHPTISIFQRMPERPAEGLLDLWKERISTSRELPDYYIFEGVKAFKQKNWEQAKQFFQKALDIQPNFALSHMLIGEIYLKNDNESAAQREWDRAIAIAGNMPKHAFIGLINAGLKQEGLVYLEPLSQQEGEDPNLILLVNQTYSDIGHEYRETGNYQAALWAYNKAISFAPDQLPPYVNAANCLTILGDLDKAQQMLNRAHQLDSTYAPIQQALAYLYQKQNDLPAAYQAQLKALTLDLQNADYQLEMFNLGIVFYKRGQLPMAVTIFEKILEFNPAFQEVQFNLGALLLQANDFARALPHLQEAVRLLPDDLDAHCTLGNAFEGLKQYAQALEKYQYVLSKKPDHAAAQEGLREIQKYMQQN